MEKKKKMFGKKDREGWTIDRSAGEKQLHKYSWGSWILSWCDKYHM